MICTWDNIALSTGSACTSAKVEPSHVIQALGFGAERAHNAIRLSVGRFNTDEEISLALKRIVAAAQQLQKMSVF